MNVTAEMPRYKCHKIVHALQILSWVEDHEDAAMPIVLNFQETRFAPKPVTLKWFKEKKVEAGGYLVIYEDGYESFSPAKAFEEGYTRIE